MNKISGAKKTELTELPKISDRVNVKSFPRERG